MTPKPRAGGKVKAWAWKWNRGGLDLDSFSLHAAFVWSWLTEKHCKCNEVCICKVDQQGDLAEVEIRELPAVKSRGKGKS